MLRKVIITPGPAQGKTDAEFPKKHGWRREVESKAKTENSANTWNVMKNQLYVTFLEYIATLKSCISSYFADFKRAETSGVGFPDSERA